MQFFKTEFKKKQTFTWLYLKMMCYCQKKELHTILMEEACNTTESSRAMPSTDQFNCSIQTEKLDSSLCWETMIGQVCVAEGLFKCLCYIYTISVIFPKTHAYGTCKLESLTL